MSDLDPIGLAKEEIIRAQQSRESRNEGRARVCARRAAGYLAKHYLEKNGINDPGSNAMIRLRLLNSLPEVSPEAKLIIKYLLIHVNPNHELPVEVDLIEEVRRLAELLLGVKM
jgi:hypothetical protein